jgi:PAS domain S-box-containing protein
MSEQEYRVLCLEDVPSDAALAQHEISKVLKNNSVHVVETESDFISELEGFKPHIVISDYQLPSFNGLSALKIVLEKAPLIPVILLTGSMNEDTAVECMKAGATDYVIKEHIKRLGPAILNALEQKDIKIECVRAEQALQKSEEKFRGLFENHTAVKLLIDSVNGNITDANKAAALFYGWSNAELKQMNIREINTLPDEKIKNAIQKVVNFQGSHFDMIHRLKDGSIRNVEVFSSSVVIEGKNYLHSIIHDITEKKRAEQQIRLLSKSIEQSPVSILITDLRGNITYANPTVIRLTGYLFEELMGKNSRIFSSGEKSKEDYKNLWKTISSGKEWKGEFHNKKKNGELYWELASISPILNENGETTHFLAVKEDITERKGITEELIKAKEKAEENDRLKTAFLHNISHEIRTPMNAIMGFSSFLNEPSLDSDKRKYYTDIIVQSCDQLLLIITDIISIATIQAGQAIVKEKETNINLTLRQLYEQFSNKSKEQNICLLIKNLLPDEEVNVITDESKLLQILNNLIGNALKFTKQGYVNFGYNLKGNEIEFFVEDTGIGIPPEVFEKIFERFTQAENDTAQLFGGSGLGLSISKAYIELLGGKIWLNSELGKGSTFYFSIPYNKISKSVLAEEIASMDEDDKTTINKTVLVAEDEDSNYFLVKEVLSGLNFKIIKVNNGSDAVKICKQNKDIDLILMDLKMPLMDGFEATRQIKNFMPNVPIIALTAYSADLDKKKAIECGCIDFISKPFKRDFLISKIKVYLR